MVKENITYSYNKQKNVLIVIINDHLRNDDWANSLGDLQFYLENKNYKGKKLSIAKIYFENCLWIDPLPLLFFGIIFKKFTDGGGKIEIRFQSRALSLFDYNYVLKFLAKEGFLSQYSGFCEIFDNKGILTTERIQYYKHLEIPLYYARPTFIQAKILDVEDIDIARDGIEGWVSTEIKKSKPLIEGLIADHLIEPILYKLKSFLNEVLHNVKRHAYSGNASKLAGIYVRIRYGLRYKNLGDLERKRIENAINRETKKCPRLTSDFVKVNDLFFEVFVIDTGVGFSQTLRTISQTKDKKYPFRYAWEDVFRKGKRRKTSASTLTEFGGLYVIGQIFEKDNDHLCGRDGNEWLGETFPNTTKSPGTKTFAKEYNKKEINGLSWIARLSVKDRENINSEKWNCVRFSSSQINPIYNALKYTLPDFSYISYQIKDNRFEYNLETIYKSNREKRGKKLKNDFILFFNESRLTKSGVLKYIKQKLIELKIEKKKNQSTLFIVDIPEVVSRSYVFGLDNTRFERDSWVEYIPRIILLTKKLYFLIYKRVIQENNLYYQIDYDEINKFQTPDLKETITFIPNKNIIHLYSWIKWHDSQLFWHIVSKNNMKRQMMVNGQIKWNNIVPNIDGYLDFSQTLANGSLKKLYSIALERAVGFFKNKTCKIKAIDELTESIADEMNSIFFKKSLKNILIIGSINVTSFDSFNVDESKLIFFFFNRSAEKYKIPSLFLWPTPDWTKNHINISVEDYGRIGETHGIAPYGWKSIPIPRYDENGESAYERPPNKTYEDWQSADLQIIKFGNFRYNNFYDLFKVDIKKATSISFEYKQELAMFLVREFFLSLGGRKSEELRIKDADNWHFKKFIEPIIKGNKLNFYEDIALIVYPSHSNTDFVIEKITEYLSNDLAKNIIPLTPIRKNNTRIPFLISPLIINSIANILKLNEEKRSILFFDDAIVSGNTWRTLKHTIESIWDVHVKTLTIIDRAQYPYRVPNKKMNKAYWRLDIPRFSERENNPISNSLNEIKLLKNFLLIPELQNRIDEWEERWGERFLHEDNINFGLYPIQVNIKGEKKLKRFGIEKPPDFFQIGGDGNKLNLQNSIGLNIYATEAQAITGKNDLVIKWLNDPDHELNEMAKIEIVCTQLLLFPDKFSTKIKQRLIKEVFLANLESSKENNHTILASIVLLNQDKSIVFNLFKKYQERINHSFNSLELNLDLSICFAYFFKNYNKFESLELNVVERILFSGKNQSFLVYYLGIHKEIYNSLGIMHDKPLVALVMDHSTSFIKRSKRAQMSLYKVEANLNQIPMYNFRHESNEESSEVSITTMRMDLDVELQQLKQSLAFIIKKSEEKIIPIKDEIYKLLEKKIKQKIINPLFQLHRRLFYPICGERKNQRPFEKVIKKIIEKIDHEQLKQDAKEKGIYTFEKRYPRVNISKSVSEFPPSYFNRLGAKWVVYDKIINSKIKNIIFNVIYAETEINDYWFSGNNEMADMWINIKYGEESISIHFANATDKAKTEIEEKIIKKSKLREIAYSLDGKNGLRLDFEQPQFHGKKVLIIKLSLPLI